MRTISGPLLRTDLFPIFCGKPVKHFNRRIEKLPVSPDLTYVSRSKLERREAAISAFLLDSLASFGNLTQEFDDLRGRTIELLRRRREVEIRTRQNSPQFRQQCRSVLVFGITDELLILTAFPPQIRRGQARCILDRDSGCQADPQTKQSFFPIVLLRACLGRGGFDSGGKMLDSNGCLDLVAVLPSRSGRPAESDFA